MWFPERRAKHSLSQRRSAQGRPSASPPRNGRGLRRVCLAVLMCLASLSARGALAATQPATLPAAPATPPAAQSYRISAGDTLAISTLDEPRFSGDFQVNGAGTISLPIAGDLAVVGLTCKEAETALRTALSRYLVDPEVTVAAKQYGALGASVFVLGEVKQPGSYPLPAGSKLMQAVAAAGGPTKDAADAVTVAKARTGQFLTVSLQATMLAPVPEDTLEPGDVVVVNRLPEADQPRRYSVLGEVPTPGMFDLPTKGVARVLDAMAKAGLLAANPTAGEGPHQSLLEELSRTADFEHALLTRGEVVVPLNLRALLAGDASQNLVLQADDLITVPRRETITVYALGELRQPGRHVLPTGATVLDLLQAASGVTQNARLAKATVIHHVAGKAVADGVDLERLLRKSDPAQNRQLQDGEALYVPSKGASQDGGIMRWLPFLPYWFRW